MVPSNQHGCQSFSSGCQEILTMLQKRLQQAYECSALIVPLRVVTAAGEAYRGLRIDPGVDHNPAADVRARKQRFYPWLAINHWVVVMLTAECEQLVVGNGEAATLQISWRRSWDCLAVQHGYSSHSFFILLSESADEHFLIV